MKANSNVHTVKVKSKTEVGHVNTKFLRVRLTVHVVALNVDVLVCSLLESSLMKLC